MNVVWAEVWYRLAAEKESHGVSCGENGAFVGPVPLFKQTRDHIGQAYWVVRPLPELNAELSDRYGLPVDLAPKRGGLETVAGALNRGHVSIARIATLHLQLPDLPSLANGSRDAAECIDLAMMLGRSGILKGEGFDQAKHPRWPAGTADSQGGQFRPLDQDVGPEETSDADISAVPIPVQALVRPAPLPWDIPFRLPAPPTEIAPYLDLPNGARRETIPLNPYPDRPECEEEWEHATEFCIDLKKRGLLGKQGYSGFGGSLWQCIMGQVSQDCGGNSIGA